MSSSQSVKIFWRAALTIQDAIWNWWQPQRSVRKRVLSADPAV